MHQKNEDQRRTGVYVDGYNLYYGRLRGTEYKWFDLVSFFDHLIKRRDQNEALTCVNLFTAHAAARFASHGATSVEAQSAYHRALKEQHGSRFCVTYGTHSYEKGGTLLPTFIEGQPYDRNQRSLVWKIEEKKTDVNIALGMYRDVSKKLVDRVILVSNDSDTEPLLKAVREDFPHVMIGVVMPRRPTRAPGQPQRRRGGSLESIADWTIDCILDEHLKAAQLPAVIPTKKLPIRKPAHW